MSQNVVTPRDTDEIPLNSDYLKTPYLSTRKGDREAAATDNLGRLSISGRLSLNSSALPEGDSDRLRDRFSLQPATAPKERAVESTPVAVQYTRVAEPASSAQTLLPDMIKNLVERSIAEAMHEIRNDIQNLHVDLIKQSLAQQNMQRQILSTMPSAYKKLADDYRSLLEENERLRAKLQ